jgi:hypothetical protein
MANKPKKKGETIQLAVGWMLCFWGPPHLVVLKGNGGATMNLKQSAKKAVITRRSPDKNTVFASSLQRWWKIWFFAFLMMKLGHYTIWMMRSKEIWQFREKFWKIWNRELCEVYDTIKANLKLRHEVKPAVYVGAVPLVKLFPRNSSSLTYHIVSRVCAKINIVMSLFQQKLCDWKDPKGPAF